MTETEFSMWDAPAEQITASRVLHTTALAKAAVEPLWPYLSAAKSLPEFESRLALSGDAMMRMIGEVIEDPSLPTDQMRVVATQSLVERFAAHQRDREAARAQKEAQRAAQRVQDAVANSLRAATAATVATAAYCPDCYKKKFGYEPDMGDDDSTFAPGTCANCGKSDGIVFTPDSSLLAQGARRTAAARNAEGTVVTTGSQWWLYGASEVEVDEVISDDEVVVRHLNSEDTETVHPFYLMADKDTIDRSAPGYETFRAGSRTAEWDMRTPEQGMYDSGYLNGKRDREGGYDPQGVGFGGPGEPQTDYERGYWAGYGLKESSRRIAGWPGAEKSEALTLKSGDYAKYKGEVVQVDEAIEDENRYVIRFLDGNDTVTVGREDLLKTDKDGTAIHGSLHTGPDPDRVPSEFKQASRHTSAEYDPNFDPRDTMTAPIGSPEWEQIMYDWGFSKGKNEPDLDWGGMDFRSHPGPFARGFRDAVDGKQASLHTAPGGGPHAPYNVERRGDKWVVVNDLGEVKGTHDSKEEAREQQKALYANVPGASEQAEKKAAAYEPTGETFTSPCDTCGQPVVFEWMKNEGGFRASEPVAPGSGSDHLSTWCAQHAPRRQSSATRKTADALQQAIRAGMMIGVPEFTHPDAMLPGFAYVVTEPGPNGARPTNRKTTDRAEANRWAEELLARTDWSPYTKSSAKVASIDKEAGEEWFLHGSVNGIVITGARHAAWTHENARHAFDHGWDVGTREASGQQVSADEHGSTNYAGAWNEGYREGMHHANSDTLDIRHSEPDWVAASLRTAAMGWVRDLGHDDDSAIAFALDTLGQRLRITFEDGDMEWGHFEKVPSGAPEWKGERNDYTFPIDFGAVMDMTRVSEPAPAGQGELFGKGPYDLTASRSAVAALLREVEAEKNVTCVSCGREFPRSEAYLRSNVGGDAPLAYCPECAGRMGWAPQHRYEKAATRSAVADLLESEAAFFHHPQRSNQPAPPMPGDQLSRMRSRDRAERTEEADTERRHDEYWDAHPEEAERHRQQNAASRRHTAEVECPECWGEGCRLCHGTGYIGDEPDDVGLPNGGYTSSRRQGASNPKMDDPDYAAGFKAGVDDADKARGFSLQNHPQSSNSSFAEGYYAGYDGWFTSDAYWLGTESSRRTAVNEDGYGSERYQRLDAPAKPDWVHDAWDEGKAPQEMLDQGRAAHEPENPFADTLTTIRQTALRMVGESEHSEVNPSDPGSNIEGFEQNNDFDRPTQPRTTRPRVMPGRTPESTNPPDFGDPAGEPAGHGHEHDYPGDPMYPTVAQRVHARVERLAAKVRMDNPTMPPEEARRVAARTVAAYPEMVSVQR